MDYEPVSDTLLAALRQHPGITDAVRTGQVGTVLRVFREASGLTQEQAGQRVGYSAATLSRIESGHRPVTVDELRHLAAAYRIPPGMLGLASYTVLPSAAQRLVDARRTHGSYAEGDTVRYLAAAMVPCPDFAADALGVPRGGRVFRAEHLTYHGDQPVRHSVTYVPDGIASRVPALLDVVGESTQVGISGMIQAATGRIAQHGEDVPEPCTVTPAVAAYLGLKLGSAMVRYRTWWRDVVGVIQYVESVTARPVRYTYDS